MCGVSLIMLQYSEFNTRYVVVAWFRPENRDQRHFRLVHAHFNGIRVVEEKARFLLIKILQTKNILLDRIRPGSQTLNALRLFLNV